jgi:hypothetical protein
MANRRAQGAIGSTDMWNASFKRSDISRQQGRKITGARLSFNSKGPGSYWPADGAEGRLGPSPWLP